MRGGAEAEVFQGGARLLRTALDRRGVIGKVGSILRYGKDRD